MTCIIGLKSGGDVWMGCDSLVNTGNISLTEGHKFVHGKGMLFGISGDSGIIPILEHVIDSKLSDPPKGSSYRELSLWVYRVFAKQLLIEMKDVGFPENSFDLLFGFDGKLIRLTDNFAQTFSGDFYCIGSGAPVAYGSLFTVSKLAELMSESLILLALNAAEEYGVGVRGPFHIARLTGDGNVTIRSNIP